ncbi:MAG: histidine phosphatase family protein [Frankiales bacterium]|nr:histidine phosphatase family protein [Frankiales bacterium]
MAKTEWPDVLMVVRHGESSGNVARDRAEADELEMIDIAERDVDVPLSELGKRQAAALGSWLAELPADERPTVLYVSPYVRAQQTARIALEAAGLDLPTVVDERLREREFGVLDRLTRRGIMAQYPDEAERRARLGKFYHRPPGGESWSDVLLRLRGALDDLRRDTVGERVLVVAHQVVVLLCRYVVEQMTEEQVLEVDRAGEVANCSVTSYRLDGEKMVLERYNETAPVEEQDEQVTAEPDVAAAPR